MTTKASVAEKLCTQDIVAMRSSNGNAQQVIQLVTKIMADNIEQPPKAEVLAEILCVSPRTLNRRLERAGVSFQKILNDVRRQRSRYYLTETRVPITEISKCMGYSDCSNFIKAFRRWEGCTPRTYRTIHSGEKTGRVLSQ